MTNTIYYVRISPVLETFQLKFLQLQYNYIAVRFVLRQLF